MKLTLRALFFLTLFCISAAGAYANSSYTKLDANGNTLADGAISWAMVKDNVTGLIWENKTDDGGVQDKDNLYTWQSAQDDFIAQLNNDNFGGHSDWRLPAAKELSTIVDRGRYSPSIHTGYFSKTISSGYWSSTVGAGDHSDSAWSVNFNYGGVSGRNMSSNLYVRAVCGEQSEIFADSILPERIVDNGDGTVTDTTSGLMWEKAEGGEMNWDAALTHCENSLLAGYDDWRLPNTNELQSLVDFSKNDPAIDTGAFPGAVASAYWSSTSFNSYPVAAWSVHFNYGLVCYYGKANSLNVRAVRTAQAAGATVPGAPIIGTASVSDGQATVSFLAPLDNGGSPITGYLVTSNPGGITATGTASPITVAGLTNGTAYTFTVQAINAFGTSSVSAISNSVTPMPTDNLNYTGNQEFDLNSAVTTDPLFGFRSETPDSTLIPTSIDYTSKMPGVKSQGSTSSCTSWATGYYYKTYQEIIEEGWDRNQNTFSPMFLYSLQCRNYAQPWSMIAAWETLNRYGCAKYATMPFVDLTGSNEKSDYSNVTISSAATSEAMNYRCGERSQLAGVNQVKQALTRGPVLLGINNYSNQHLSSGWHPSPENNYLTYDSSNSNVGHAILCIGYDDSKFGTGALKFINSWGQDWAIDGFSWLRYSDYGNIVLFAMSIQDIPNANRPDNTNSSPAAPSNVTATDNAGPYVDITWSMVSAAQYYRIFRAKIGDSSTYSEIGTAYQGSYRDNPEPGVIFYYSVVSYNDVGNSDHYASDTDTKAYVDKGSASGSSMSKPVLSWLSNDNADIRSDFSVSNLAADVSAMEVIVASSSAGPWHSFGWAMPGNFYISWGEDSEYIGKKPFVKIVVSSASGTSESSNPVQVGQTLVSSVNVADITSLQAASQSNGIQVSWSTNGGKADSFEIWRWLAAEDEGNEWIMMGYADGTSATYTDTSVLPGKSYYYAVAAVYRGTYGEFAITDDPASIVATQANLFLYQVLYDAGEIYNPANFELTVWNDGGTPISDYTIVIYVYDWDDGKFYYPFDVVYASDYSYSTLYPGYSHTLYIPLDLPSAYADGHFYSWIIEVDYYNDINELYEDDNKIVTYDWWWSYYLYSPAPEGAEAANIYSSRDTTGSRRASSRPFSKNRMENMRIEANKIEVPFKAISPDVQKNEARPIQFKKPTFCVDHDK